MGVALGHLFTTLANMIASPFYGMISEQVQVLLTDARPAARFSVGRTIGRQVRYLAYMLPRTVAAALLFLVPLVWVAAPAVWFALNAWMSTVQYVDYPSDNNGQDFPGMLAVLRKRRADAWAFGALVAAGSLIPLLNLVVMPAAVAGATAMWLEAERP
jgi:CysZ protein